MSTAVIDSTPVIQTDTLLSDTSKEPVEVKTEAATETKVETKTEEKPTSIFDEIKVRMPNSPPPTPEELKAEADHKAAAEKAAAAKLETKPEPTDTETPNRANFKRAEEAKKAAIAEAAALKKQLEEIKAGQVNPESSKQLAELQAERDKLRSELRVASIERDPEFQAKFTQQETRRVEELKDLAKAAGFEAKEFEKAFARGDEDALAEMESLLEPSQKRQWNNHLLKIEEIRDEKKQAIADSEKTWAKLQEQQKANYSAQAKQVVAQNTAAADEALQEIIAMAPGIESDPDMLEGVKSLMLDVSGATENSGKWTTKEILKNLAFSQISSNVVVTQGKAIAQKDARIKELEEKLAESERFVSDHTSSAPRSGGIAVGKSDGAPKSMLEDMVIRIPGR